MQPQLEGLLFPGREQFFFDWTHWTKVTCNSVFVQLLFSWNPQTTKMINFWLPFGNCSHLLHIMILWAVLISVFCITSKSVTFHTYYHVSFVVILSVILLIGKQMGRTFNWLGYFHSEVNVHCTHWTQCLNQYLSVSKCSLIFRKHFCMTRTTKNHWIWCLISTLICVIVFFRTNMEPSEGEYFSWYSF